MVLTLRNCILILFLSGLSIYLNSLNNKFIGDDFDQIVFNPRISSAYNIPKLFSGSTYFNQETGQSYGLYYRPLMLTAYTFIYSIFGADPFFFRLFQVNIHILNSILILLIFRSFFPFSAAFFSALIFLVHPINNETVVYIANLQDTLFMFFGTSAFLKVINSKSKKLKIADLLLISLLMLFSLLSKETGILFIPLIIFYAYLFKRNNISGLTVAGFCGLSVYLILRSAIAGSSIISEKFTPVGQADLSIRLLNIPKIWLTNFQLFIFPKDLILNQMWLVKSAASPDFYIPFIILIIISGFFIFSGLLIKKNNKTRYSQYLFFSGWLFSGLLFHSQIYPLDATFADRWFYFPIIGLLGITVLICRLYFPKNFTKTGVIFVIIFSLMLSLRTIIRNRDWRDAYTLFSRDLKTSGDNYYLENSLASLYIDEGKYGPAKPLVESSVKKFPYFGNLNNMAVIYAYEKDFTRAGEYFEKAIEKRGNYSVYLNYANFLAFVKNDPDGAKAFIEKALKLYPESSQLKKIYTSLTRP